LQTCILPQQKPSRDCTYKRFKSLLRQIFCSASLGKNILVQILILRFWDNPQFKVDTTTTSLRPSRIQHQQAKFHNWLLLFSATISFGSTTDSYSFPTGPSSPENIIRDTYLPFFFFGKAHIYPFGKINIHFYGFLGKEKTNFTLQSLIIYDTLYFFACWQY